MARASGRARPGRSARDRRDGARSPTGIRTRRRERRRGARRRRSRGRARAGRHRSPSRARRVRDIGDRGQQGRIDHRGAEPEQRRRERTTATNADAGGDRRDARPPAQHPADDERLAAHPIRQRAGDDLTDAPDGRVERGQHADLADREPGGREEQRQQAPGHPVVEVVDEAGLATRPTGRDRGTSSARRPRATAEPSGRRAISLLVLDVPARLAHEERPRAPSPRPAIGKAEEERPGPKAVPAAAMQPVASAVSGDRAVAGGLVEAHREAAPGRTDEVDLHDHRRRPGQALVDAEQHVRRDHPAPGRRPDEQERNRQADQPAGDQDRLAAEAVGEGAGGEVRRPPCVTPKATTNVSAAANAGQPEDVSVARSGTTVRSWPTIPPTSALTRPAARTGRGSPAARAGSLARGLDDHDRTVPDETWWQGLAIARRPQVPAGAGTRRRQPLGGHLHRPQALCRCPGGPQGGL